MQESIFKDIENFYSSQLENKVNKTERAKNSLENAVEILLPKIKYELKELVTDDIIIEMCCYILLVSTFKAYKETLDNPLYQIQLLLKKLKNNTNEKES